MRNTTLTRAFVGAAQCMGVVVKVLELVGKEREIGRIASGRLGEVGRGEERKAVEPRNGRPRPKSLAADWTIFCSE